MRFFVLDNENYATYVENRFQALAGVAQPV
jgi:hypothetical protein